MIKFTLGPANGKMLQCLIILKPNLHIIMQPFVFHLHPAIIIFLIALSLCAGLIDTIAGGGSLITVPALLTLGFPPVFAFGTSKFQSCIGEFNASYHFCRSKKINLKTLLPGFIFVSVGSIVGTLLIQFMSNADAEKIIPWLLLCVVLYTYLSPYLQSEVTQQKISRSVFFSIFGLAIGFYNGFLGPGTGALWVFVFMYFLGLNLVNASMHAKPLNMTGSFFSLLLFMIGHHVIYAVGMIMAVGQLVGSRIGAHLVLEKGIKLVRPLYLLIVTMMTLLLFVKIY